MSENTAISHREQATANYILLATVSTSDWSSGILIVSDSDKCTFIAPSGSLFLTCRGEKYTVPIQYYFVQYTTIEKMCVFNRKKPLLRVVAFDAQVRIHSRPMMQVNCPIYSRREKFRRLQPKMTFFHISTTSLKNVIESSGFLKTHSYTLTWG